MAVKSIEIKAMTQEEAVSRALNILDAKEHHIVNIEEKQKSKRAFFGLFTKEGIYVISVDKDKRERKEVKNPSAHHTSNENNSVKKSENVAHKKSDKPKQQPNKESKPFDRGRSDVDIVRDAIMKNSEVVGNQQPKHIDATDITEELEAKVNELMAKMNLQVSSFVVRKDAKKYAVRLHGEDKGIIIGKKGKTLTNIEYFLNNLYKKYKIEVDAEGFRGKRAELLKKLGEKSADKVLRTGRTVKLEPMTAQERKIIHEVLNTYDLLESHSEGKEPRRFIVIKKKGEKNRQNRKNKNKAKQETKIENKPVQNIQENVQNIVPEVKE